MALQDPVAIYHAANDIEAQLFCNLLNEAGLEAYFTEDALVGQFPKPQVWVDRSVADQARSFLQDHKRQLKEQGDVAEPGA